MGLSQTVKSMLTSKSSEGGTLNQSALKDVNRPSPAASTSLSEDTVIEPVRKVVPRNKKASVPVTVNLDLLGPDSEIDTPVEESSDEEEAREVLLSDDESSDEETQLEAVEGVLEWPVYGRPYCQEIS